MRLLYSASLIIMLIDILTKNPIKEAVILCNGKQNPYVSKDNGYYIFCNLYPGKYNVYIYANGYVSKELNVSLEFGESKKFMLELSFESTNQKLVNIPRIEFSIFKDKELVKNKDLKLTLKTPIKILKLIQNIEKGEQEIILNVPENNNFILQNYIYSVKMQKPDEKENSSEELKNYLDENDMINYPMFFLGYDKSNNMYILDKEVGVSLPMGGTFLPYWNLKTDKKGKVILPIIQKIMHSSQMQFEIQIDQKIISVESDMNKMDTKYKILKVDINLDKHD